MKPFSWAEAKKEAIKHRKYRIAIYEKAGRNKEALMEKEKLKRLLDDK